MLSACCGVVLALTVSPGAFAATGIAFSDAGGSLDYASAQGGQVRTLFESTDSIGLEALDFSPDGTKVLAHQYGDAERLALVPAGGGNPVPVAGTDGATSGSFSPDGKQIVFAVND